MEERNRGGAGFSLILVSKRSLKYLLRVAVLLVKRRPTANPGGRGCTFFKLFSKSNMRMTALLEKGENRTTRLASGDWCVL